MYDVDIDELKARDTVRNFDIDLYGEPPNHWNDRMVDQLRDLKPKFLHPLKTDDGTPVCTICNATLFGLLFGSFRWSFVHGEGSCSECGWPYRLYHYLDDGSSNRQLVQIALAYHPDVVVERAGAEG